MEYPTNNPVLVSILDCANNLQSIPDNDTDKLIANRLCRMLNLIVGLVLRCPVDPTPIIAVDETVHAQALKVIRDMEQRHPEIVQAKAGETIH